MSEELVQIFCKLPKPGAVKTRLIGCLGEEGAAELASRLAERTIGKMTGKFNVEVWHTPVDSSGYLEQFECVELCLQSGSDLGTRMAYSLAVGLERASKVVLIGCDCPLIDSSYILEAIHKLDEYDVVFGPAEDGGYGLVGVRGRVPDIFTEMSWSTDTVLAESCRRLNQTQVSYALLPLIWDVDRPEDLERYYELVNQESP